MGKREGRGRVTEMWKCAQSCPTLGITWSIAHQHGISRQEDWSGLPFPPPGDLPDPGIKPGSPALQAGSELCGELRERETC